MPLLKTGYSHYNIGQRPYEMAYKAVETLDSILKDGKAPADPLLQASKSARLTWLTSAGNKYLPQKRLGEAMRQGACLTGSCR